jgi:fucose 4-O-acetylase-like acetyltransferase
MTTIQTLRSADVTPPRQREAASVASPAIKRRVPLWDNARFTAVVLVIMGHATLKMISGSDPAYSVYLFIYAFHIPVFVAVSGYFAKSTPPGVRQLKRLFSDIVVPYVIFETIWSGIHWAMSGKLKLDYTTAWWTLWFLIALCVWRVVLPYLVVLRFPFAISVVLAVGAGYISSVDDTLSLSRAIALLPFFVLGWKVKQWRLADRWLELSDRVVWRWRAAALAMFGALAITSAVGIGTWRELLVRRFLLYDETYSSFGYSEWWAGVVRLGVIGVGVLFCFAFLALMPRRQTWFSALGTRTMYIYLLHSFLLYPLRQSGIISGKQTPLMLVAVLLLSLGIAVVLGLPIIQRIFRPFVEPKLGWLFGRRADANPQFEEKNPTPALGGQTGT